MSTIHWANAVDGSFQNPEDWTGGVVPGIADEAVLDAAGGSFTVTSTAYQYVGGLELASNATLAVTAQLFVVAGTTVNAGHILVDGSGELGLEYAVSNSGVIDINGSQSDATLDGVVNNSPTGAILAENGAVVFLSHNVVGGSLLATSRGGFYFTGGGMIGAAGGITLGGDITVDYGGEQSTQIDGRVHNSGAIVLSQVNYALGPTLSARHAILDGGGEILLGSLGYNRLEGIAGQASSLDNIDNLIVGAGAIGDGGLFTLTNEANGKIESAGPRQLVIDLGADVLRNQGYIRSNGAGGIVLRQTTVDNRWRPALRWCSWGRSTMAVSIQTSP